MSSATSDCSTAIEKIVRRNPETRDFDALLIHPDGTEQYLGSRARSWDAEALCNEAVYVPLSTQPIVVFPVPSEFDEMERIPVVESDLGDGLSCDRVLYIYQEDAVSPVEVIGQCDAYRLQTSGGEVIIEMDDNLDFHRRVGVMYAHNRTVSHNDTAAELLQLADLLRRDEVYTALQRWAAEDAA